MGRALRTALNRLTLSQLITLQPTLSQSISQVIHTGYRIFHILTSEKVSAFCQTNREEHLSFFWWTAGLLSTFQTSSTHTKNSKS